MRDMTARLLPSSTSNTEEAIVAPSQILDRGKSRMYNSTSRFWKLACLPLATAAVSASAQQMYLPADSGQLETGVWTFHQEHVLGTSLEISIRAASLIDAEKSEAA